MEKVLALQVHQQLTLVKVHVANRTRLLLLPTLIFLGREVFYLVLDHASLPTSVCLPGTSPNSPVKAFELVE